MGKNIPNKIDLEKEIATIEISAIEEEQIDADYNYAVLDENLKNVESKLTYPDVQPFDTVSIL